MCSIEWWNCRWPWVIPNRPKLPSICTFCTVFYIFVMPAVRNFKFVSFPMTLSDLEGHSPVAGLIKCNATNTVRHFARFQLNWLRVARSLVDSGAFCLVHVNSHSYRKAWISENIDLLFNGHALLKIWHPAMQCRFGSDSLFLYTLCLKKTRHQTLAHNFPKC